MNEHDRGEAITHLASAIESIEFEEYEEAKSDIKAALEFVQVGDDPKK